MASLTVTLIEEDGTERTLRDAEVGYSLMEVARANGVVGILADCGGACACATCHVYIEPEWVDVVGPPDEVEAEMLDMVSDIRRDNSRLSCQIPLQAKLDGLRVKVAPAF